MKKVILSVFMLLAGTIALLAQDPSQAGAGQGRTGQRNPGAAMGLIKYDLEEATDALNMGDGNKEAEVMALIMEYNVRMDSLTEANKPLFEEIRNQMRSAMQDRDFEKLRSMRAANQEKLAPIRATAEQIQSDLDAALKPLFDKKQQKSWEKYKEEKKATATQPRGGFRNN